MDDNKPNFIQRLTRRLGILYEAASLNLYTLILLIIVYLFYWTFPQAKDLLVTLNQEADWQVIIFFATLVNMAAICWYIPRFLYKENNERLTDWRSFIDTEIDHHRASYTSRDEDSEYHHRLLEMIPRLLGFLILFIVALGILNIGNEISTDNGFPWGIPANAILLISFGFIAVLLLFGKDKRPLLFVLNDWLVEKIGNKIVIVLGIGLASIVFLGFINNGGLKDLPWLLLSAILIAFGFLVFTVFRNTLKFVSTDRNITILLVGLSFIFSLFFIYINIDPRITYYLNPLTCANLAFIFYLTILYAMRIIGVNKKIYFVFFVLVLVSVSATLTNSSKHHEVSYNKGPDSQFNTEDRYSVESYFEKWVNQRRPAIQQFLSQHPNKSYPIFIISSEGGGSRAAYWTNITHAYLQNKNKDYYSNHLFALTGASGGNTGNSTFFTLKQSGVADDSLKSVARTMFEGNFLSSSLTLMMGFDLWQSIVGLSLTSDRAKELEKEWTEQLTLASRGKAKSFSSPFLGFWYDSGTSTPKASAPPLLLINTTHVQSGGHAIISPVTFDTKYYDGLDLLQKIDSVFDGKQTLPLSTATLLNASFPYINPAGYVSNVGSFVDAGYYDNYGIQSAVGLFRQLDDLRKEGTDSLYQKLEFISVLIRNGTVDPRTPSSPKASQFLAPVSTVANLRSAFNTHNRWLLDQVADVSYAVDLSPREEIQIIQEQDTISPVVPLARYLSPEALIAMDTSLQRQCRVPNSDISKILQKMQ